MTVPKFGESPAEQLEPVDEVRLYPIANPAPVPLEPGELPASYGTNRLVLLPVDPYLIHVYWDLASTAPPAAGAKPVLRFHESFPSLNTNQTRPFDVDVDFTTSSWYVNLWSPDKLYYADLGWRNQDGSFVELARSNTVRTPPAWPHPVEPVELPAAAVEVEPPPAAPVATPRTDVPAQLQRRLAELFGLRDDLPPVHEPIAIPVELEQEIPGEPPQLAAPMPSPWIVPEKELALDLTGLSEERFTPGISSDLEGSFGK